MSGIRELRNKLEQKKGQREHVHRQLLYARKDLKDLDSEVEHSEQAQAIIQAVAKQTQEELQYRITEPISLAMAAVYEKNPYKQTAEFKITGRGTTECHLGFERDGNVIKPFEASGGGPVDISAYALRLGSWSLAQPRSRPVLIYDEPFRFVSKGKMALAGEMIKESSKQIGLQIIMVTHIEELIDCADRTFNVQIDKGVTYIEEGK